MVNVADTHSDHAPRESCTLNSIFCSPAFTLTSPPSMSNGLLFSIHSDSTIVSPSISYESPWWNACVLFGPFNVITAVGLLFSVYASACCLTFLNSLFRIGNASPLIVFSIIYLSPSMSILPVNPFSKRIPSDE